MMFFVVVLSVVIIMFVVVGTNYRFGRDGFWPLLVMATFLTTFGTTIGYYHCLIMTKSHKKYRTLKAIKEIILQHIYREDFEEAQSVSPLDYKKLVIVYKIFMKQNTNK